MGYRGKLDAQMRARELRAQAWTLDQIAAELGVAKSSVSLWVRDVKFEAQPRRTARRRGPNVLQRRKAAEIESLQREGLLRLGSLSEQAFLAAGAALYAGEGSKGDGDIVFANSNPLMVAFFCAWLRNFFDIDERRLRVRVYLHEGLDLDAAHRFWSDVTGVPLGQFRGGYRAVADPTIRHNKHQHGCVYVRYCCSRSHRAIMGLIDGLLGSTALSGVAQSAERLAVNETVGGSSPSPGAGGPSLNWLAPYSASR
jgi:hypothetical protein